MARAALGVAGLLVVLLLLITADVLGIQAAYAGRMYPGVRALGASIGGMSRDDARLMLAREVDALADRPIVIGHQELRWTVAPRHLDARYDVDRLVDEAYRRGRDGNVFNRFFVQFGLLFNGRAHEIGLGAPDLPGMTPFLDALAAAVNRPVADAALMISQAGQVQLTDAVVGRRLVVDATQRRLEEALSRTDLSDVQLVVEETAPTVGSDELTGARAQAEELLAGPVTFKFEGSEWQLSRQELASMVRLGSASQVGFDRDAVKDWVGTLARDVNQSPQNARFTWSNGALEVLRPSKVGRELDVDRTADLVIAKSFEPDRTLSLPVAVTKPDVSQEDGPKLGIKGAIEVARTSYASAQGPKRHNISLAAQRLNGVVVPPGKLFSFNQEVGPTTLDNGYQLGWMIQGGGRNVRTVPAAAGGICQVATTLFHSVYWSGYQIEERNHHLYWIPGYATRGLVGLDATVEEDYDLDFQFYNNTDNYLLIQAWTEGTSVIFGLYGTKPDWTVKVQSEERKDVVAASRDPVTEEEPSLPTGQRVPVEGAQDGFKITHTRTVARGDDVRTLRLTSNYKPSRNVTVVGTGGRPARPPQVAVNQATRATDSGATRPAAPAAQPGQARPSAATPVPSGGAQPAAKPGRQTAPTVPPRPTTAPNTAR